MYIIENNKLYVEIARKGAEVKRIINKDNNKEYMWKADPEYWGKTAPVLFPFIGGQNKGRYVYKEKEYLQLKHGFARDNEFEFVQQKGDSIKFLLSSSNKTFDIYPFKFNFYIIYYLKENKLFTKYVVENKTDGEMIFSLGAHPAFAAPLLDGIDYEDYYIEFEKNEEAETFVIDGVLFTREKRKVFSGNILELNKNTFEKDAYVFEKLNSKFVTLKNKKNDRSVKVSFEGFPYVAFWNVPGAEFVCIEPWYGINDYKDFEGEISKKEGVQKLDKDQVFEALLSFEIN